MAVEIVSISKSVKLIPNADTKHSVMAANGWERMAFKGRSKVTGEESLFTLDAPIDANGESGVYTMKNGLLNDGSARTLARYPSGSLLTGRDVLDAQKGPAVMPGGGPQAFVAVGKNSNGNSASPINKSLAKRARSVNPDDRISIKQEDGKTVTKYIHADATEDRFAISPDEAIPQ